MTVEITSPTFYVAQDEVDSIVTRFTPNDRDMTCYNQVKDSNRWCTTLNYGSRDYLFLSGDGPSGTLASLNVEAPSPPLIQSEPWLYFQRSKHSTSLLMGIPSSQR